MTVLLSGAVICNKLAMSSNQSLEANSRICDFLGLCALKAFKISYDKKTHWSHL